MDEELLQNEEELGEAEELENAAGDEAAEEEEKPRQKNAEADAVAASARRAIEAEKRKNDKFAKKLGYKDFEDMKASSLEAIESELKESIADGDDTAVERLLELRRATDPKLLELEETAAEVENQMYIQRLKTEFDALSRYFPENGLSDPSALQNDPHFNEIAAMYCAGTPLWRAYAAFHLDEISEKSKEAAKRAARNEQSKEHLSEASGGVGGGGKMLKPIPKALLEDYREWFPDDNDKQLMERYNRILKRQEGAQ